jgi:hypothetical protein
MVIWEWTEKKWRVNKTNELIDIPIDSISWVQPNLTGPITTNKDKGDGHRNSWKKRATDMHSA